MSNPIAQDLVFTWSQALQFAVAVIPIGFLAKWLSYRERRWRFSSRKTKALRRLLKDNAWRKAPPIELQYAFQDAFGRGFDPVDLAFIEGRQKPLMLIRDRLTASNLVRLNAAGNGFERTATSFTRRISLTVWAFVWSMIGWFCMMLAVFLLIYAFSNQQFIPGLAALDFATLAIAMFIASRMCEAAQRVFSLRNHDVIRPIPPSPKKAGKNRGLKKPDSISQQIDEESPASVNPLALPSAEARDFCVESSPGSGSLN